LALDDNRLAFAEALSESGWLLARGDRRDFVAVDSKGGTHSLARRMRARRRRMCGRAEPSRLRGLCRAVNHGNRLKNFSRKSRAAAAECA